MLHGPGGRVTYLRTQADDASTEMASPVGIQARPCHRGVSIREALLVGVVALTEVDAPVTALETIFDARDDPLDRRRELCPVGMPPTVPVGDLAARGVFFYDFRMLKVPPQVKMPAAHE